LIDKYRSANAFAVTVQVPPGSRSQSASCILPTIGGGLAAVPWGGNTLGDEVATCCVRRDGEQMTATTEA
jgi:hypothetical protein